MKKLIVPVLFLVTVMGMSSCGTFETTSNHPSSTGSLDSSPLPVQSDHLPLSTSSTSSSDSANTSSSSTSDLPPIITGSISVLKSSGSLESVYAEFQKLEGADQYNAYISETGKNVYEKLDDMLIREYSDHVRVDAIGLPSGSYDLKITAVADGHEINDSTTVISNLPVTPYDREGFGFVNGDSSGAYTSDGSLKAGAQVIYITEKTKNTVTCSIKTGSNTTEVLTGFQNILLALKKGYETRPFNFRLIGKISDPEFATDGKGDIVIDGGSKYTAGLTIEGVGNDTVVYGWGIRLKNCRNVEIRNLGFMACDSTEGDCVGLQQNNEHIYVHNCDFFYGLPGADADQVKGDGSLDCKKSTYVTFSYNHYFDAGKCNLLGLSENTTEGLYITYHHNWFDHSDSRHPRVRYYSAHVYNNYYDGISKYGIGATNGASVFSEANYFRHCKYPMLISMQGSDIAGSSTGTFSSEDGGIIKSYNNFIKDARAFVPYSDNQEDFDAYVATSREENVPSTVVAKKGGSTYNNFDTSPVMYEYEVQTPEEAKTTVMNLSGRIQGGDFKWTFDNSKDDTDYGVNEKLKAAILAYESDILKIGSIDSIGSDDPEPVNPVDPPISDGVVHNFTVSGKESSFFTINGNLSNSKGTVTYDNLILTQCLKMESSTLITFATEKAMTLTIVTQTAAVGKRIEVDGVRYTAASVDNDVVFVIPLEAGTHSIKKTDSINIFMIILA